MKTKIDFTGKKFGRLTALNFHKKIIDENHIVGIKHEIKCLR
jgi:hypothetical protein